MVGAQICEDIANARLSGSLSVPGFDGFRQMRGLASQSASKKAKEAVYVLEQCQRSDREERGEWREGIHDESVVSRQKYGKNVQNDAILTRTRYLYSNFIFQQMSLFPRPF
jgi:hypothetical protein